VKPQPPKLAEAQKPQTKPKTVCLRLDEKSIQWIHKNGIQDYRKKHPRLHKKAFTITTKKRPRLRHPPSQNSIHDYNKARIQPSVHDYIIHPAKKASMITTKRPPWLHPTHVAETSVRNAYNTVQIESWP